MHGIRLLFGVVGAALVTLSLPAAGQSQLPPGPNRELVARICGSCHDVAFVAERRGTTADWVQRIDEMISYGLRITPEERTQIIEYLTTALRQ